VKVGPLPAPAQLLEQQLAWPAERATHHAKAELGKATRDERRDLEGKVGALPGDYRAEKQSL
jgi:hypothetical protein